MVTDREPSLFRERESGASTIVGVYENEEIVVFSFVCHMFDKHTPKIMYFYMP